ncbi:Dual oxidase 1 [Lamellibrachia satsuma]|nr:Dual oxidase 1 [Lamellibrachia satsuma]
MAGNSLFTGLKGKTHFGRPNFEMLFHAVSKKHPKVKKVGVFSCGPAGLTKSVCSACSSVSKFTRTQFPHFYENF